MTASTTNSVGLGLPAHGSRHDARPAAVRLTTDRTASWAVAAALSLAAFYFATSLYISAHRLLWIDEVLTALTSRLPGDAAIWQAFAQGADGLPPTYFMLTHFFDGLFRHSDFGLRVPSALAITAGLLLTFDCARRLTDGLHGLIAFSVLTCSFLPYYGHEARSYAIYFMLAALALWIWIRDTDGSWPSAVGFGVVLFLAVTMHYYAVLALVPYAAWEMATWKPWQRLSRKTVAGVIGILCAVGVLWTPIQAGRHLYPADFWARPSLDVLQTTFTDLFPGALLLLACVALWIACAAPKDGIAALPPMLSAERLGCFFLLIPIAAFVLAQVAHAFQLRYVIAVLPGIAIAFSCWLWRGFQGARYVSVGVLVILAACGLARQLRDTREPSFGYYSPIRQILGMEEVEQADGKQFFAVSNPGRYLEALYYSKHSEHYVYVYTDSGGQHEMRTLSQHYPMHFWTVEDLAKHATETALILPTPQILEELQKSGIEVNQRTSTPVRVLYLQ